MTGEGSNRKRIVYIILLLLTFTALFFYFGYFKAYLYEDEVLSYTAANSIEGMRPSFPLNRVVSGSEFVKNAVTAGRDSRFNFSNAIKNTSEDPHPPLYLLLLHFISSLFPETFSKWFGLTINLIAGGAAVVFIFLSGLRLFSKEENPEIPSMTAAFLYVFSVGFMNQLMNLRMYVLLQAFTTLLTLRYLSLIRRSEGEEKGFFGVKEGVLLSLNVLMGVMTHYYFLIFAFYEAAAFTVLLVFKKDLRSILFHTGSYIASGILTLLIFPPIIWQLTSSDVGQESFLSRDLPEIIRRLKVMTSTLSGEIFGGELLIYIIAAAVLLILAVKREGLKKNYTAPAFLIFTALFYFLTVSLTTPYLTGRYLSPDYPVIFLILVYLFLPGERLLFRSEKAGLLILALVMAAPLCLQIRSGLYDVDKAVMQELSKSHSKDICVFFRGISAEENYFELENYERVMAMRVTAKEGEDRGDTDLIKNEEEVVFYVPAGKTAEECLNRIQGIDPGFKTAERLYKAYYSEAWVVKR